MAGPAPIGTYRDAHDGEDPGDVGGVGSVGEEVVGTVEGDEALGVSGRFVDAPGVVDVDQVVDG